MLEENERLDDLICSGYKIIQSKEGFCFSIDSVLLANFAYAQRNDIAIDLGTGSGVIAILMAAKYPLKYIYGVEIQGDVAKRAMRSVMVNRLEDRVGIMHHDIKNLSNHFTRSFFDIVVTNPPYIELGKGLVNPDSTKAISRHEIKVNLKDIITTSSYLLKDKGKFFMVHRPERLCDIMFIMRTYEIEPKRIRLVHPRIDKRPSAVLVEGLKGGERGMVVLEPLIVYKDDGQYTPEIYNIYFGKNGE